VETISAGRRRRGGGVAGTGTRDVAKEKSETMSHSKRFSFGFWVKNVLF